MSNEQKVIRKLKAILSADVKGYSILMADDEVTTVHTINAYREVMTDLIQGQNGSVVDAKGDNVLAGFSSVVDAVRCAVDIQKQLALRNAELPEGRKMEFRIGVNLGDVIDEEGTLYGDGVNVAARLEGLADPGGVAISGTAFDQVRDKINLGYQHLGEVSVKNILRPIRAYKVLMEPEHAGKLIGRKSPTSRNKWPWLAVSALALLIGIFVWQFYYEKLPPIEAASVENMAYPLPEKPSIAVLPFDNMSGDPKEDYLSDGLTEQIITNLSKFHRLFVIARNSTFVYKGKPVKVQKVAEDLGVQYVLEGSVQKSGDKVRITAQLINALTGHHVWSERYDRETKDIFALQDEITLKIGKAMKVELTEGEHERYFAKWETDNLKAFEKNYQGFGFLRRGTKQDNDTARQLFEEAIAIDPKYIFPVALLGHTHFADARFGWSESPVKSVQKAFELAKKAIAMDDSFDVAHALMATVYLLMRQYDNAIAEAEKAIDLNPNGAGSYGVLGAILGSAGNWQEGVPYLKKAIRLSPLASFSDYYFLGRAYFMLGQYDESLETLKKAMQANPNFFHAQVFIVACYSSMGRDAEATAAAKEVLRINPKFTIESYAKTIPYKDKTDVERELAALRKAGLPEKPLPTLQ